MGCSGSSGPKTFRQCDAWHPDVKASKGGPCGPLAVAPKNSMGSCGSTISTSAGAASSLRTDRSASATSSLSSLQTLRASSRDARRLPTHLEVQGAGSTAGSQVRAQSGGSNREVGRDPRDNRSTFKSASQSRPVPRLGPIEDSTMMERRRSKSKEMSAPATPSTAASAARSGSHSLQAGGCQPARLGEAHADAETIAGDF